MDMVLERKSFGTRWRKWIKGCFSLANFLIMINGRRKWGFRASKGLRRQGDPLSPSLFTLVVDVLSRIMEKAVRCLVVEGFEVELEEISVSHLLFADNTLFFWKIH